MYEQLCPDQCIYPLLMMCVTSLIGSDVGCFLVYDNSWAIFMCCSVSSYV